MSQQAQAQDVFHEHHHYYSPRETVITSVVSNRSKWLAFFLCLFLGVVGVHRFYVGKFGTGLLYMFTGGFFGIGIFIDLVLIAVGSFRDQYGHYLRY